MLNYFPVKSNWPIQYIWYTRHLVEGICGVVYSSETVGAQLTFEALVEMGWNGIR